MHYFIDYTKLTTQDLVDIFGVDGADPTHKFNITSRFQLTEQAKAFACQKGLMIVQQSLIDDALVNVILKPIEGLQIPFNSIKYYVYRGLLKSSFLSGTSITPQSSNNSEFISRVWDEWNSYKTRTNKFDLPAPTPQYFGYDDDFLEDNLLIENIFNNSEDVCPVFVKEGEWIGDFGCTQKIGFEIITETENLSLDLHFLRAGKYQIDVTGLSGFELRAKREQILSFIDPAAFFGLHYDIGVNVSLYDGNNKTVLKKKQDELCVALLDKFATKNRVYLDIRSEHGYSYNFYQNYNSSNNNAPEIYV